MALKSKNKNSNIFFSREHLKNDLKRKSVHGALYKVITNGTSIVLTLASTIVLARLLAPEIFGLFAMVLSVSEIARYLMEIGLGTATVQKEEISHTEVSALFWVNFFIGFILMICLAALAPAVAWFFSDIRLLNVCLVLSVTFIFRGVVVQHRALLERQMSFGQLGAISITSNLISYTTAIALAYYGFGVWALVWREIAFSVIYAAGCWLFCDWMPGQPKWQKEALKSLRFGADLSGVSIMQYLTTNLDKILIGRYCGASPLGLYTKSLQLAMMPVENIRQVFWDVGLSPLSALQKDTERYLRFFGRLLSIQTFFYMPIMIFLAIQPEITIRILLGEAWVSATPVLRLFAIAGFVTPIIGIIQLVMISCGNTRKYLKWGIFNGFCMISAYLIGINWGIMGIAFTYVVVSYLLLLAALKYCLKDTPVNMLFVASNIIVAVVSCLIAGVILSVLLPHLPNTSALNNIVSSLIVFISAYLLIIFCIPKGRKQLAEFWAYRKEFFHKR